MMTTTTTNNNELRRRRRHGGGVGIINADGISDLSGCFSRVEIIDGDDDGNNGDKNKHDDRNGDHENNDDTGNGGGGAFSAVSSMSMSSSTSKKKQSHHKQGGGKGGGGENSHVLQQQQQQQPLPQATPPPLATMTTSRRRRNRSRLADAAAIDHLFPKAAALAVTVWLLLLLFVYTCIPNNSSSGHISYPRAVYLSLQEQEAAMAAFFVMCIATLLLIMPTTFVFGRASSYLAPGHNNGRKSNHLSGIVVAALAVQFVSCATNGILAFLPNVVIVDPITHAPVYLTRWCEWIVLSGLMTFLSETIDLEKPKAATKAKAAALQRQAATQQQDYFHYYWYRNHPLFHPILSSMIQSLSCVCGIVFPFCRNLVEWLMVMLVALVTYLYIFPRVLLRKRNFDALLLSQSHHVHRTSNSNNNNTTTSSECSSDSGGGSDSGSGGTKSGSIGASGGKVYSVTEMEEYERRRFGYYLMLTCSIVWTILVVMYFLNMMAYRLLPSDHPIRLVTCLAMVCDTFFDVLAKALYMKLIVDVHKSVFDEDGRAHRQLKELRQLMSVFWEDCSDVIVISVQKSFNSSLSMGNVASPQSLGLHDEYGNPCCMYTTMLSSAFPRWVMVEGEEDCNLLANRKSVCLTLEIRAPINTVNNRNNNNSNDNDDSNKPPALAAAAKPVVVAAYFVDSSFVPSASSKSGGDIHCDYNGDIEPAIICYQDVNSLLVQEAAKISNFVWQWLEDQNDTNINNNNNTATTMHPIRKANGETCFCESKVSRHAGIAADDDDDDDDGIDDGGGGGCKSLVAVVRDVTERVRRFEAEQRAHAETLARQRDAQSVNRFTRHEVKNGLLAGIELCDNLRVLVEKNHPIDERDNDSNTDINQAAMTRAKSAAQLATEYKTEWTGCALATLQAATITTTTKKAPIPKSSSTTTLNNASTHDSFLQGVLKQVKDLENALHDILSTVLEEATARDVIHEVYRPQLVPINVEETLTGSAVGIGRMERFPLIVKGMTLPTIEMDTQLLCYIHRNAVSNACKYGKAGGLVQTIIGFDNDRNEFELQVINEVGEGHDELLSMGDSANDAVFEQGKRLSTHLEGSDKHLSFGDGAWIMRKCAKALNGSCTIQFEKTQTVVTFKCPATPVKSSSTMSMYREFEVPPGTWGIALDDSKIQRKILGRILSHVGVEKSRLMVLGNTFADVDHMGTKLLSLLQEDKESKFLILVDEILDYSSTGEKISGSCAMKEILDQMTPEQECRVLALVRSANDAHHDVQQYCERTHGFFPKSPTQRDRVRETLAPLWLSRFEPKSKKEDDDAASSAEEDDMEVSASEVLESLKSVQDRVDGMTKPLDQKSWSHVWNSLHCLRGDLMMVDNNEDLATASWLINELRGPDWPSEFQTKWDKIQATIQRGAKKLQK